MTRTTLVRGVLCLLMMLSFKVSSQTIPQTYRLLEEIDFQRKLGNAYPNAIKNFSIVIDQTRNRAYISPILNTDFPIIDVANNRQIGSVKTSYKMGFNLVALFVNPRSGYLYTWYNPLHQTDMLLRVFDPVTSQEKATYTLPMTLSAIAAHPVKNQIIIGQGPRLKMLDADKLLPVDSVSLPNSVSDIVIDTVGGRMYVVSSNLVLGTKQRINVIDYSQSTYPIEKNIEIPASAPLGRLYVDRTNNRMILVGASQVKAVTLTDQTEVFSKSFSTMFQYSGYSEKLQKLVMLDQYGYAANGENGDWIKIYTYDFKTNKLDSTKGGLHTDQFAVDDRNGKVFIPIMHSGDVDVHDLSTMAKTATIDIGESVEDVAIAPDGKKLYIADRLGDNSVATYDFETKTATALQPGNWPVAIEVDTSLKRLFTMNHYESSVSVLSTVDQSLVKKIELTGIDDARTDGLSFMYLCQATHRLYVVIPERQQLAVIDGSAMTVLKTMAIHGYTWDEDEKSVGRLQVVSAPDLNYFYILRSTAKKLNRYNATTFAFIDSMDLSSRWNARLEDFSGDLLAYDATINPKRLYIGPLAVNAQTHSLLAQSLPTGARFLGYNQNKTKAYSLGIAASYVTAYEHDPSTMLVTATRQLNEAVYGTPIMFLDATRDHLYMGDFATAKVYKYDLDNVESFRLAAPVLGAPSDGQNSLVIPPLLIWNTVAGATAYHLQVSTFSTFTATVYDDTTLTTTSKSVTSLANATTYYWRVRAKNGAGWGAYSPARSFTTMVALPAAPTAAAASAVTQTGFTANWVVVAGASGYTLDVASDSTFSAFVSGYNGKDVGNVTSHAVTGLLANTTYYYRVKAYNTGGAGSASRAIGVTTLAGPTPPLPAAPTLVSPADNTMNVPLALSLTWNAIAGATKYHLQLSAVATFATTTVNDSLLAVPALSVSGLSLATTYYWRARAKNDGGWGPFSAPRQFTTIRSTSVEQLGGEIPQEYALAQNFPNPFNPATTIRFALPTASPVTLRIFDLLGRQVTTLVSEDLWPGHFSVRWDGSSCPSGIYLYEIQAGEYLAVKRMVLLK